MVLHISSVGVALLLVAAFSKYFIYPTFLSPLARIPAAHWSCHFSPVWLLWVKWTHRENATVYDRHMKRGPAIRLAPNVVSINCFEDGLKKIYQGGFPKPRFYFNGFAIYDTENIFTFEDNETHSARKRIISNTFSKSYIMASPTARAATRDILYGRYLPLIHKAAVQNLPVEVLELNYSYSMDTFVQWQFGRSIASNLVENQEERRLYLDGFFAPSAFTFWQYEFPEFARLMRRLGVFLIPKRVDAAFHLIEDWNLKKCDQAQQLLASGADISDDNQPVVFEQAIKAMSQIDSKPRAYAKRLEIASDMFAHNSAAMETSGNTETYLFYEMCRNPQWQTRLREELYTLSPRIKFDPKHKYEIDDIPQPKDIESLPILHAIIMETLRLYPSVPGGQPRVVPRECQLAGHQRIPVGTIVQSYAYSLHRTPEIFPDPYSWKPERWLTASPDELAVMKRWFWAFGSGGRMCIGSNFAFYSMKFLVAAVFSSFTTTIHDHGSMELVDAYLAGPKGHRLELEFHVHVSTD